MDEWLILSIKGDSTYDARHYQYAWKRFLEMIKEQQLKISEEEKQEVKNYIFQGGNLRVPSRLHELVAKCLTEAKVHCGGMK